MPMKGAGRANAGPYFLFFCRIVAIGHGAFFFPVIREAQWNAAQRGLLQSSGYPTLRNYGYPKTTS
jgi:hypothetical protein